ncbi:MAG: hypothetical protein HFH86_01100 [Bacilli bacterium]|nr:hypothetical protein [Bacilli bacterium]
MKNNQKKGVFITIIVLLIIFLPLSVCSFVLHLMNENKPKEKILNNPTKQFQFNNSLYFYSSLGNLLRIYECQNPTGLCDYATSKTNDQKYALDYYQQDEPQKIELIKERYAFLVDAETEENAKPFLYDVTTDHKYTSYASVKNYGIGIENDLFIVENETGKFGLLSLKENPTLKIKFEYDFLGLANFKNDDEEKLMSDFFVGLKDNAWFLLDMNGAVLTEAITSEIVSFNGKNIIVKTKDGYYLTDYQNNMVLSNGPFQNLFFTGKYLNILEKDNQFYIYDITSSSIISKTITVLPNDKITSKINENGNLDIIVNQKIVDTIALS